MAVPDRPAPRRRGGSLAALASLLLAAPFLQGNLGHTNVEERLLAAHNRERASLGIPPLRWDEGLARDAAVWAQEQVRLGRLEHYPDDPGDPDPQGENLWAGTKGYYGIEAMVGLWIDEKRNFRPGAFPHNARNGVLNDIGHYTQLMWRTTGTVGCAVARGRHDDFLVCRYLEGGNVMGEVPF